MPPTRATAAWWMSKAVRVIRVKSSGIRMSASMSLHGVSGSLRKIRAPPVNRARDCGSRCDLVPWPPATFSRLGVNVGRSYFPRSSQTLRSTTGMSRRRRRTRDRYDSLTRNCNGSSTSPAHQAPPCDRYRNLPALEPGSGGVA